MKKIVWLSALSGFAGGFLLKLMADYSVSDYFVKATLTDDMFARMVVGVPIVFALLSSVGFVLVAAKQSAKRIWSALGIESAAFAVFIIADLALKISGVNVNLFPVSPEDNPAVGFLISFSGFIYIVLRVLTRLVAAIALTVIADRRNNA